MSVGARRVMIFAISTLLLFYVAAQVLAFPIRWISCMNLVRTAALTFDERKQEIRDIMCSPGKLTGVWDTYRNASKLLEFNE